MTVRRVLTVFASLLATLSITLTAHAAPSAGDLIKLADDGNLDTTADSAVYYAGSDGKRYAFPNSQAYFTWYADFAGVKIVSPSEMASLSLGGNITYRPGTRLIKIVSDPKVYAVEPSGVLRPITSETVAKALYGDTWSKRIDDVPDTFFTNYSVGEPLGAAVYPTGSIVQRSSDGLYFRIENGTKRKLGTEAVRTAIRVQDGFVLQTSSSLSEYTDGTEITTAESSVVDTAQKNSAPLVTIPTFTVKSPPTAYIPVGRDVTLLDLGFVSPQAVTIRKIAIKIEATTNDPADATLDDDLGGLIYGNNAQSNLSTIRFLDAVGGEPFGRKEIARVLEKDQSQTFIFEGNVSVSAGTEKRLRLIALLNGILPTGQGYKVTLMSAGSQILDGATGQAIPFSPTSDLAGTSLSSLNASLEVSAAGVPGSPTYVRGAINAAVAGFVFKATTVAPNVVTSLIAQGYIDEENQTGFLAGGDSDNGTESQVAHLFPSLSLYDNATGKKVAGPSPISFTGLVSFSGFTFAIPAGQSGTLVLKGDIPKTVDLENSPDRVSFDIVEPEKSVVASDDKGVPVSVIGVNLNKGVTPVFFATIKKTGTMTMAFTGNGGNAVTGKEVQVGTMTFSPKDDDYDIRTLAFIQSGTPSTNMTSLRLEYPITDTTTASVSADAIGNGVTFSNLPIVATRNKITTVNVFGKLRSRDGGAVNGELIAYTFAKTGPLQFVSRSTSESFTEGSIGTDYTITTNTVSSWRSRFSTLTAEKSVDSPSAKLDRTGDQAVLHFALKTDSAGPVRVKKMTFKVAPADAGKVGANNDSLERWARLNGDFEDDDAVINLRRIVANEVDPILAEGSSGHIRYSMVHGGVKSNASSTIESTGGDYGMIEVEFDEGSEYYIPAGTTAPFSLSIDTSSLADGQDYNLSVTMNSAGDFLWTEVPSGAYTALTGTDAVGLGLTTSVIVSQ